MSLYYLKSRPKNTTGTWGTVDISHTRSEITAALSGPRNPAYEYAVFHKGAIIDGPYDGRTLEHINQLHFEV